MAAKQHKPTGLFSRFGYRMRLVWISFLVAVVLFGTVAGWFAYEGSRPLYSELKASAGEEKPPAFLELVIPYGTSARGIAVLMQEAGLDAHEGMFLLHARWLGVHKKLQAGVYVAEPGITKRQMILRLARMDPSQTEFRILEGWTVRQILSNLSRNPDIRHDLSGPLTDREIARRLGLKDRSAEGWLFPESYVVPKQSTASELLIRSARLQAQYVQAAWQKRAADLPYKKVEEALVIASIIEKETQMTGDREKVAAVFVNRMRLGMPLQADPTVIYGLGSSFDGNITRENLLRDTPYNTYTRKTLPPTPISNPGRKAIEAAMRPADSKAIFFVARGDGSSQFSETLQEHNAAVNKFIRRQASSK